MAKRIEMDNWKRAVVAGSAGVGIIFLLRGSRTGAMICGGVALAALASEYPEKFAEIRTKMPDYMERGAAFLDVATRVGERIADVAERRGSAWYESLMRA